MFSICKYWIRNMWYIMLWLLSACSLTILQYVLWPNWRRKSYSKRKFIFHNFLFSSTLFCIYIRILLIVVLYRFVSFSPLHKCNNSISFAFCVLFSLFSASSILTLLECLFFFSFSCYCSSNTRWAHSLVFETWIVCINVRLLATLCTIFMFPWLIGKKTRSQNLYKTFI